jgi:hypothetical protein
MFYVQEMIFMNLPWLKYVKSYFWFNVDYVFVQFFLKFHVIPKQKSTTPLLGNPFRKKGTY